MQSQVAVSHAILACLNICISSDTWQYTTGCKHRVPANVLIWTVYYALIISKGVRQVPGNAGRFARSTSDIQRAYDAAPGPPSKGSVAQEGPPSAPPAQPLDHTTSGEPHMQCCEGGT